MVTNTDEIIKEIRKRLHKHYFFPLTASIGAIIALFMDIFIYTAKYANQDKTIQSGDYTFFVVFFVLPVVAIMFAFAIRRILDWLEIQRKDAQERGRLLLDLTKSRHYEEFDLILTGQYIIFLNFSIKLIPIDDILWIYKDIATDLQKKTREYKIMVQTSKGRKYCFTAHSAFTVYYDSAVNGLIRELFNKNSGIMIGNCSENKRLYIQAIRTLRKQRQDFHSY